MLKNEVAYISNMGKAQDDAVYNQLVFEKACRENKQR